MVCKYFNSINTSVIGLTAAANLVFIMPGATQLTLMLFSAKSKATTFVSPRRAVLLTEYAPKT